MEFRTRKKNKVTYERKEYPESVIPIQYLIIFKPVLTNGNTVYWATPLNPLKEWILMRYFIPMRWSELIL